MFPSPVAQFTALWASEFWLFITHGCVSPWVICGRQLSF